MTITVITPWHEHLDLARDYWHAMNRVNARVLIIDNGSNPPLPNAYRLESNTGFCHACNVGLDLAHTEAIVFVNNDVYSTDGDWLRLIEEAIEPGVLVGPRLRYDQHGSVDGEVLPYLDGWCLGGMTEDFRAIGGFEECLEEPAYFSDNYLCLKARLAGMTLREVKVGLRHKKNRTAGLASDACVRWATEANRERFHSFAREALLEVV